MQHDESIFISAIYNFWPWPQILGGQLTPSPSIPEPLNKDVLAGFGGIRVADMIWWDVPAGRTSNGKTKEKNLSLRRSGD